MDKAIKPLNLTNPQYFKALKGVREAASYFEEVMAKFDANLALLDQRESALANIDVEYAEKLAAAQKDLEYNLTVNAEATFNVLATKLGMGVISLVELDSIRDHDRDLDTEINAAVGKAVGIAQSKAKADNDLAMAELKAELKFKEQQLTDYKNQITFLKEELAATRTSAESMVEHAGKSTVITSSK